MPANIAEHFTEEIYECPKCHAPIGILARLYGRPVFLRLPMLPKPGSTEPSYHNARSLNSVCECCGTAVHFAVADDKLAQLVLELQALNVL